MYRVLLIMVSAIYLCYPLSGYAQEECGDSYYDIYNGDCDFKNEDTHLWGYQPGTYFAKEDRVEELIQQGESFIDNYYASVKTSGDLAFRFMIAPTAASMTIVETQQAIVTALLLANDGYDLKELYTDAICEAYWEALESITGIDRDCPTTSELLTDIQQLGRLDDVRTEILDIITNPNLVLGEQWNSVIGEINSVRSRLSSLETFGRNIATPDIETRFNGLYPSLANLIAAPNETRTQYYDRVEQNIESRRITLREHMLSTRQHHEIMTTSDKTELEVLDNMSSRAVGEMQADEIDNMLQMQGVQNVLMMSEEIMNINALFIQNHVDANDIETRRRAYEIKAGMPIPGHEVAVGNEAIFTR